jgi:hypothetical protein
MATYNRQQRFGLYAVLMGRNNPDGTKPSASNMWGFANTCDLSAEGLLTSGAADLTVKIDDGSAVTKSVDFSSAVSDSAVTIAEAVTALQAASFTSMTFSSDTDKDGVSRLKAESSTGTYIQITGALAAALDFGQGIAYGGHGLEIFKYIGDHQIGSGLTSDTDQIDDQTKDSEGPTGGVDRVNIPAIRLGFTAALTVKVDDWGVRECVERGVWNRTDDEYDPPTTEESKDVPKIWIESFAPLMNKSVSNLGEENAIEKKTFWTCTGNITEPEYSFDFAARVINIKAAAYKDETNNEKAADHYKRLSKADYLALDLANV